MPNRHGLDSKYFQKRLERVIRDLDNFKPDELARELARISRAADEKVLSEPEFSKNLVIKKNTGPITINM